MGVHKPKPLFYILIKDARTRPRYKTKTFTVYTNGVPKTLKTFMPWLREAIEEKVVGK